MNRLASRVRQWLTPPKPAPAIDASEKWFVDRWSYFRGVFEAQGWAFRDGRQLQSITLCDKNGRDEIGDVADLSVKIGLPSSDVETSFGSSANKCRFEISARIPSADQALRVALQIHFDDGSTMFIDDPAARAFSVDPYHSLRREFFDGLAEQLTSGKVVEIGARARSGNVIRDLLPPQVEYVGVDIVNGPNVDVVADAHELSRHFEPNSIDAIFSVSVFEHLLMPWKVALEINKVLKPGGLVLTMTHQSFPPHDQPWDFWRISDEGWHGLFNRFTGFEVVKTALGEPLDMVARVLTEVTKGFGAAPGYTGSAAICRKIGDTSLSWPADLGEIVSTRYPK